MNGIAQLSLYAPLLPEAILLAGAMLLLMLGVFRDAESARPAEPITWLAVIVLALAGFAVLQQSGPAQTLFDGAVIVDPFARFMKLLVLVASAGALVLAIDDMREVKLLKFEYPVLVLLATTGMLLMISANDLISLYLGLELQNLALYVIAAFRRDAVKSSEAGLKYFVLGALSSGLMLYGASLVYGFTGATTFPRIAEAVQVLAKAGTIDVGLVFGLVFLLAGLAFKIAAVPFHMWTPDVYEGAPTPVTTFFAAAPKSAAMAMILRLVLGAFPDAGGQWKQIIVFLAMASMVLGAFAAIGQTNIKRLMAYSSIANMGYALVGLAAGSVAGVQGVLIYLAIYLAMTLGAFACILSMRRAEGSVEEIDELKGLAQNNPPMAFLLAMLFFSLAGVPPLAGFFAKFYVFTAAVQANLWPLAVVGVLSSVVGAYYYLKVVKVMFFDAPAERFLPMSPKVLAVLLLCGAFVLGYVAFPAPLVSAAEQAAKSSFRFP